MREPRMSTMQDQARSEQCLAWNSGPVHQIVTGQARAHQFRREYQVQAGQCSFLARWRAGHGHAPLSVEAAARYVAIEGSRGPLGQPVPAALRTAISVTWCPGRLVGVALWLQHGHDDPPRTCTS